MADMIDLGQLELAILWRILNGLMNLGPNLRLAGGVSTWSLEMVVASIHTRRLRWYQSSTEGGESHGKEENHIEKEKADCLAHTGMEKG